MKSAGLLLGKKKRAIKAAQVEATHTSSQSYGICQCSEMLWEYFHAEPSRLYVLRCHPRQQTQCFPGPARVSFCFPNQTFNYCIYFTLAYASKFPDKNSALPILPFHQSSHISEWCVSLGFVWSLKVPICPQISKC